MTGSSTQGLLASVCLTVSLLGRCTHLTKMGMEYRGLRLSTSIYITVSAIPYRVIRIEIDSSCTDWLVSCGATAVWFPYRLWCCQVQVDHPAICSGSSVQFYFQLLRPPVIQYRHRLWQWLLSVTSYGSQPYLPIMYIWNTTILFQIQSQSRQFSFDCFFI